MAVVSLSGLDAIQALAHPLRLRILDALREPGSAAQVARALGQPRQNVNYHLKELERVGLVELVGERRTGNFVESIYRAIARSFVVSPRASWADGRRAEAMAEQLPLEQLVAVGELLQRDAVALLDRATFDGDEVASASVTADVSFCAERDRTEFLRAYLAAVGPLLKKYGAAAGERYRIVLAAYPTEQSRNEEP